MSNSSNSELDTLQDNSCFYCDNNPCSAVSFKQFVFHTEEIFNIFGNFIRIDESNYEIAKCLGQLDDLQRSKVRSVLYRKFVEWSSWQMRKGLRHELPNCVTHMLRSYIPSTDGIYKGYTTYNSKYCSKARAVTIDDVLDKNHH